MIFKINIKKLFVGLDKNICVCVSTCLTSFRMFVVIEGVVFRSCEWTRFGDRFFFIDM